MLIQIKLPNPEEFKNPKHYLKQLELSVHHAKKAFDEAEKNGEWDEEKGFIAYRFPSSKDIDSMSGAYDIDLVISTI